jgi:hypothetical protein
MPFSRSLQLIAISSLLIVAACDNMGNWNKKEDATPRVGSLTQNLTMVDSTGRVYGSVQLDPINGGKVFDADGRLIGRVVNPTPAPLAPMAQ